jgi:hypothetical protein
MEYSTLRLSDGYSGTSVVSSMALSESGSQYLTATASVTGLTTGRAYRLENNNSTTAYVGFNAEL